jgi:hypothetical protein
MVLYCTARSVLEVDPTQPWADPVDLWLMDAGEPGAFTAGRSIYLYSVKTPRSPGEWLRELAHEYGHVSLPGIGGFVDTDDPWVDGHLGELLLPKWVEARGVADRMPWPSDGWVGDAATERTRLLAGAHQIGADEKILEGGGADARDYFLGLALHVESVAGPELLGAALRRCPGGTASQFVAAASRLGREMSVDVWGALAKPVSDAGDTEAASTATAPD